MSIHNRDGDFEANPFDSYNINSVTARPRDNGSVTLDMASEDARDRAAATGPDVNVPDIER